MKTVNVIIFFAIFFTVYGLVNYYIFIRGLQAIPADAPWRAWYLPLFLFVSLAFIAGRFLERAWLSAVSVSFVWVGAFWLAAMAYFFLAVVFLDLLRFVNWAVPFFPHSVTANYPRAKLIAGVSIVSVVGLVVMGGALNALFPEIRALEITLPKRSDGPKTLRIVAASDIHLGTIIGRWRFSKIVDVINGEDPDLVLLAGDIVDEDLAPVIKANLGESLRSIRSKYGIYAITGNHEYIGGAEEACRYLEEHGVRVLRDTVARIPTGLTIAGREDRSIRQFSGKERRPLGEILKGVDRTYPVILMDHQPFGLDQAVVNGVDVQISGHTHHGQLWPFNLITEAIYEISWGYAQKGDTHFYVSSGVGSWGPPVRTGNRPEVVRLTLNLRP
jgi:hypothetical protein